MKRLYLVGCSRSGTTLLQSMLASHSQIISFPETHFFSETLSINPVLRRLKLYGPSSREYVRKFLERHKFSDIDPFPKASTLSMYTHGRWCQKLSDILDEMTMRTLQQQDMEQPVWGLEKTPRHVHYISSIESYDQSSNFLHLLREGRDVVASMHLATKEYPEEWDGVRSIRKCIGWWKHSMQASFRHVEKPNHFYAVYEQLVEHPKRVLKALCQFLELDYQKSMMGNFHNTADSLIKEEEEWKNRNVEKSLSKSNKLENNFDQETIAYIDNKLPDFDLKAFYH